MTYRTLLKFLGPESSIKLLSTKGKKVVCIFCTIVYRAFDFLSNFEVHKLPLSLLSSKKGISYFICVESISKRLK